MGVTRYLMLLFALLTLLPMGLADTFQDGLPINGCAIPTPNGLVQDRDCDGVDDFTDNCKYTPNTEQHDSNRNGIGDVCDLLVTSINLEPGTEVKQGTFFTVKIQLINNKEFMIEGIQTRIRQNGLDIDLSSFVDAMRPGEQRTIEFVLKAPSCATPGRYELTFTTDHNEAARVFTQTRYQRIEIIEKPGACNPSATSIDNTIVETITHQEAELGDRVVYPVTITNLNDQAKTYHLSLDDINYIGTYRIDPSPTFTVSSGKTHTVYLYVQTENFAPIGRNAIRFHLESEGVMDTNTVSLRLIKSTGTDVSTVIVSAIQIGLILIVLALIIGAGIVAYQKLNADDEHHDEQTPNERTENKRTKKSIEPVEEDDDFESYY
jgi:hypothetical protein